jgi:putative heme-binding domain-containing protein
MNRVLLTLACFAAATIADLKVCTTTIVVQAFRPAGASAVQSPNDYSDAKSWLCRPGRHDACDIDHTTTVVAADGKLTRETWSVDPNAPIDCFYVYPTISTDQTPNSDMTADPAELNVIKQQFARLGSKCRPYAPLYRQVTLAGLSRLLAGGGGGGSLERGVQYDDVRDAWNYYLQHDSNGRGFVLVAHSQGSFILNRLIREEIDGKPIQSQMVSAILLGTVIAVPKGKDVGGSFQHVPLCHSATQTGCVITFAAFRSTIPPPANTLFGKVSDPNMVAACTNPAALGGGSGELHAYLDTTGRTITSTIAPKPWVMPEQAIDTPWVGVPGLLTAKCASNEHASGYLEVTVHGNPADPRVDDIVGDIGRGGTVAAIWGLHLIDVNLVMGNLLDIVGQQAKAYASVGVPPKSAAGQTQSLAEATAADLAAGKRVFDAQCAWCHGADGTGGAGPNFQRATLRHANNDASLIDIVRNGIPGTEMPGSPSGLTDRMAWQIAAYVRSLGRVAPRPIPGDPQRGAAVYQANGCAACHVVLGSGGVLGPDLTAIGALRGPAYLRESLIDPAAAHPPAYLVVRVVTNGGAEIRGIRLNEDVFWIHLRDQKGALHVLQKADLSLVEREPKETFMPSYASRLSGAQLDDLVAYLASLRGKPRGEP